MTLRHHQAAIAQVISESAARLAENHDQNWAGDALAPLGKTPNIGGAYIFSQDHKLLAAYGEVPSSTAPADSEITWAMAA